MPACSHLSVPVVAAAKRRRVATVAALYGHFCKLHRIGASWRQLVFFIGTFGWLA